MPNEISKIDLTAQISTDIVAGTVFDLTADFYDDFGNKTTNAIDKISISSDDQQATLPAGITLNPAKDKPPGEHTFSSIVLKSAGARTITVKDEATGATGSIDFVVYAALPSVTQSLFETTKNILIIDKEKADLKITIFDQFKNPIAGKATKIENDTTLGSIDNPEQKTADSGQSKFVYTPLKEGKDTLTAFMPDNDDPTKNVAFSQTIVIDNRPDTLANRVASAIDTLKNNPTARAIANVAKNVVAAIGALGLLPLIANILGSAPSAIHAVNYGVSLTLEAAGIRKKRKYWGRVFNTTSGKGVDMALVRLYDAKTMNLVTTAVSDIAGKYNFHPKPGKYVLSVSKEGYLFPTQIFAQYGLFHKGNEAKDQLVESHYLGQAIEINETNPNMNIEIPIDPVREKAPFFLKVKLYAEDLINLITVGLSAIFVPTLIIGSVISIFTAIILPERKNIALAILYVIVTGVFVIGKMIKAAKFGIVLEAKTKKPIPGAMVSLFDQKYDSLKSTAVTDKFGRFTIFVPKGRYYLKVQKSGYTFGTIEKKRRKMALNNSGDRNNITVKDAAYISVRVEGEPR